MNVIRAETESKWRRRGQIALRAFSELTAMVAVGWVLYICWCALHSMRP